MARTGLPLGNPVGVVLPEQPLIGRRTRAVCARISPAVQEIAALALLAAAAPGRLRRRGAVIENPDLAEIPQADDDLILLRVVRTALKCVQSGGRVDPGATLKLMSTRSGWAATSPKLALSLA